MNRYLSPNESVTSGQLDSLKSGNLKMTYTITELVRIYQIALVVTRLILRRLLNMTLSSTIEKLSLKSIFFYKILFT